MKICLQNQKTGLPVIFRRTSLYSGGILAMTLRYLPPAIFHHLSEQTSCDDNFEKPVNGIPRKSWPQTKEHLRILAGAPVIFDPYSSKCV